jgi:hypothetical protein
MKDYFYLIPIALCIGITALATFMWSLAGMSQNRIGKRHTGNGIEETFRHPVWHSATE